MSIWTKFATDDDRVTNGVRFELDGVGFVCAHAGAINPRYLKAIDAAYKPHRVALSHGVLGDKIKDELALDIFVSATLLSWDGMTDSDGSPLPFSRDNARRVMRALPSLYETLRNLAADVSHYRPGDVETDAGN